MVGVVPYEQRLNADRRWALLEGSMHFEKESAVYRTMQELASRLDELNIPYAVVGGMALFQHGFRRFTEDVDMLVTKDSLVAIHEKLEGLASASSFSSPAHFPATGSRRLCPSPTPWIAIRRSTASSASR